jgi:hypothetical protein
MTPEEAQQAQTIAEDRKKRDAESWETYLHEQSRSYPEDLLDIDHGAYRNICSTCGKSFQGFKRRFICRVCKIANLKSIVDSQAQKIAEQEAMVELGRSSLQTATDLLKSKNAEIEQQAQKLTDLEKEITRQKGKTKTVYQLCRNSIMFSRRIRAEQAKEIEKLSDCLNGSQHKYKLTKTWPKEFSRMQCEDCHDERELTEQERISNNIRTKQEFMDELDASVKALNEQQEINNINKLAGRLKISKELDTILDIQDLT